MLKEEGKKPQTQSYMWLYHTGIGDEKPVILYDYQLFRNGDNAVTFLKDFKGWLMQREHFEEYKKLGLNNSYYKKERCLSQMQLAEKINISRTHMSRIENNDCTVSLDVIFSIASL